MKRLAMSLVVFVAAVGFFSFMTVDRINGPNRGDQTHQSFEPISTDGSTHRPRAKSLAARSPRLSKIDQLVQGELTPLEQAIDDAKKSGDMEEVRRLEEEEADLAPWENSPKWLRELREKNGWTNAIVVVTNGVDVPRTPATKPAP